MRRDTSISFGACWCVDNKVYNCGIYTKQFICIHKRETRNEGRRLDIYIYNGTFLPNFRFIVLSSSTVFILCLWFFVWSNFQPSCVCLNRAPRILKAIDVIVALYCVETIIETYKEKPRASLFSHFYFVLTIFCRVLSSLVCCFTILNNQQENKKIYGKKKDDEWEKKSNNNNKQ